MFSSSSFGISDFTEVFNPFGIEFVHVSNAFFTMIIQFYLYHSF